MVIAIVFAIGAAGCVIAGVAAHVKETRSVNRMGRTYNLHRWGGESNHEYMCRIRSRMIIGGQRRW